MGREMINVGLPVLTIEPLDLYEAALERTQITEPDVFDDSCGKSKRSTGSLECDGRPRFVTPY